MADDVHALSFPAPLAEQIKAAMATMPPGALRVGTRYDARTRTWTIGEGPTLADLNDKHSHRFGVSIGSTVSAEGLGSVEIVGTVPLHHTDK